MNGPLDAKKRSSLVTEESKKQFFLFLKSCGLCEEKYDAELASMS